MLVTAKMDMRVMIKLSVARSSGKLDLSDCGLTDVPAEVCDLRNLEASSAAHQQFFALGLVCLSFCLSSRQPLLSVYCFGRPQNQALGVPLFSGKAILADGNTDEPVTSVGLEPSRQSID